jgi:hypothetical protein
MTEIDRLFTNATEALDAIVKYRAAERARNANLKRIDVTTLRNAEPSDDTLWLFYKAAAKVFPEAEVVETFDILCEDAGVDADGEPLVESETRGLSDEEFDYRHAIGWRS